MALPETFTVSTREVEIQPPVQLVLGLADQLHSGNSLAMLRMHILKN